MPIISSVVLMGKGILFLSKTSAAKVLLVKLSQYAATHSIAAAVTASATVATAAGVFVVAKSIPQNSVHGFQLMVRGIQDGNCTDFLEGVAKISSSYTTATSLISDFCTFVDGYQGDNEVKISLKKSVQDLNSLIVEQVENQSFALLREVEAILKEKGVNSSEYSADINTIYRKHTFGLSEQLSYNELLGICGKIYDDLYTLNVKHGIRANNGEYDHYLVYCIAGWVLSNINLPCMRGISQKNLAQDITNNIFAYLHAFQLG